jgi:hypothetical protein
VFFMVVSCVNFPALLILVVVVLLDVALLVAICASTLTSVF